MFGSSTQFKHWTFKDENEVAEMRKEANQDFISKNGENMGEEEQKQFFLNVEEEVMLVRYYEHALRDFCRKFKDPRDSRIRMPPHVSATAQHYFKRFYLINSVMEYHPKDILVTCAYLACKIEEFYVTIGDFVHNLRGDKSKAAEIILNNELQLTCELQFHLIVHQPYRPVEGLLIDIKTRFPKLQEPERLRPHIDEFLEKVHLTDAFILYAPSQIALAAVTTAVSRLNEKMDEYVTDILFQNDQKQLMVLIEAVKKIKRMVKNVDGPPPDPLRKEIDAKLELCRNQQNNPSSSQYRTNYTDFDDDPEIPQAPPEEQTGDGLGVQRIRSPSTF